MAIDFNVKDVIHKIAARFVPAYLPEAKKPYYLKAVNQPVLDVHGLASKAEVYNITTPPKIIEEGHNAAILLSRYLAADGFIVKNDLYTLKVGFPGEYDGTETSLCEDAHPVAKMQPSAELRAYIRERVEPVIEGRLDTDGFIAEVTDEATGVIDEEVTAGRLFTIRGLGIRTTGENAESVGVYFCPKEGGDRVKVVDIAVNGPKIIKLVAPAGLKKGTAYSIEIVTQSSLKGYGHLLKNERIIRSDFTVVARK